MEETKRPDKRFWHVGLYIRLSREDGDGESESVANQRAILRDELPDFFARGQYEIVDEYVDDGASGTTDREREAFQRMVRDVESGRIDCVAVKNLSRAFRNSADQGRFLEEFLPLHRARFLSLYQPRLDTLADPESVHGLEVGVTGFLNEQYAYKTSCDVRRTLRSKREKGEFIGAFAPYGYAKDPNDKNALIVDDEAAEVVRDIYLWFVRDGASKAGIARRLNERGVPNPTAYKRAAGLRYQSPAARKNDALWSQSTISRILRDPLYIGTLRQGRQRRVSYKVHKEVRTSESEWFVVENAVPPVVDRALFDAAQRLQQNRTRTGAERREPYLFSGLVRCADCGKAMARHSAKGHVYYACRTHREKSKAACGKHTVRLDVLERAVLLSVQRQIERLPDLAEILETIERAPTACRESARLDDRAARNDREREKAAALLDGLYRDWKSGEVSHAQYRRMKTRLEEQLAQLQSASAQLARERAALRRREDDPYLTAFLERRNVRSLSRGLLTELLDAVYVHADGSLEIAFAFADPRAEKGG